MDALLVALAWQEVLARISGVNLYWNERALLGISVWIIYSTDHLLDGLISKKSTYLNQAPRHTFVQKHRLFFSATLLIALLGAFSLLHTISFSLSIGGALLALLTCLYLLINTFLLRHEIWPQGKEILISMIFTLGCGLIPLIQSEHKGVLFVSMLLFFVLCSINCTLIARLERGVAIKSLLSHLMPSLSWTLPIALVLLLINNLSSHTTIISAFLGSLIGLSLVPSIAKWCGYEVASLAADGALILGATLSFY
ncbi:MAG: hypothetical protein K9M81_03140 [Chthoniobacterales bacterium]|nr:hypothetical protein [Chthoniobacterales bacterium]